MGRITKDCLLERFEICDLVEPTEKLIEEAKVFIDNPRARNFFQIPLQDWTPEPDVYDVIWNQWVLLYLTDEHLVDYLERCKAAIRPSGMITVKENVVLHGRHVFDEEDNSITRTDLQYKQLFEAAGLELVLEQRQFDWPQDLFPVMMYALRPARSIG